METTPTTLRFDKGIEPGPDGVERFRRIWHHPEPRAAILYVHGMTSHGDWFESSYAELAEAGYTILMPDRIGAGRSQGVRGDVASPEPWLADYRYWLARLRELAPGRPIVVVGACFGGRLAVPLLGEAPDVQGLVLTAPGFFANVPAVEGLGDKFTLVRGLLGLGHGWIRIPFPPEVFTANPAGQEFIRNDSLQLRKASTRTVKTVLKLDRMRDGAATRIDLPVLALIADADRMVDNVRTERWLHEHFPADRLTIEHLPGYGHIPDLEADRGRYLQVFRRWLDALAA